MEFVVPCMMQPPIRYHCWRTTRGTWSSFLFSIIIAKWARLIASRLLSLASDCTVRYELLLQGYLLHFYCSAVAFNLYTPWNGLPVGSYSSKHETHCVFPHLLGHDFDSDHQLAALRVGWISLEVAQGFLPRRQSGKKKKSFFRKSWAHMARVIHSRSSSMSAVTP